MADILRVVDEEKDMVVREVAVAEVAAMTFEQAAEYLQVISDELADWLEDGCLPGTRLPSGEWRVLRFTKPVLNDRLTPEESDEAADRLIDLPILLRGTAWRAGHDLWHRFAREFNYLITPCDASYLHRKEAECCDFWAADERQVCAVAGELPWIRSLSQFGRI